MPGTYVAIDLETTGLDPERDRITEVAAVRFTEDGEVVETFQSFVNPGRAVPRFIETMTGVTTEMVLTAPPLEAIAPRLIEFIGGGPVVGQNVGFDLGYLRREGIALDVQAFDTARLSRVLLPQLASHGLADLARVLGIEVGEVHRALPDAELAARVFLGLRRRALELEPARRLQLARVISMEDPLLAAEIAGDAWREVPAEERAFSLPEPAPQRPALERRDPPLPVRPEEVRAMFQAAPGILDGFEVRQQQLDMAEAVREAFVDGGHWLVEAGTGVGKSLAYLVPASLYAVRNGARVIISTNTINLQEQLLGKDIPALKRMLIAAGAIKDESDLRVALLKGRANYLCLHRFAANYAAGLGDPDFARLAATLLLWLPETTTGDRAELSLDQSDWRTWQRLSAQEAECLSRQNAYVREGRCFLQRARSAAESAHIVVVNHALLLADLASGRTAIPAFDHLVIDEAHNLEDVATKQFGASVSRRMFDEALAGLYRAAERGQRAGGVAALLRSLGRGSCVAAAEVLERAVDDARQVSGAPFVALGALDRGPSDDGRLLLTGAVRSSPDWGAVEQGWDTLDSALRRVFEAGINAAQVVAAETGGESRSGLVSEVEAAVRKVEELRSVAAALMTGFQEGMVTWSAQDRDGTASLEAAPLHVGPRLWEELFSECRTVVGTSATLSAAGSMAYTAERLGLSDVESVQLGSPFDYERSTVLAIPTGLPDPNSAGFDDAAAAAIEQLVRVSGGRALVLFTSHAALQRTANRAREAIEEAGIAVLVQGQDGTPQQLTRDLLANPRSVVFGTSSFWEGVDIRGDALSLLVITRLPFAVPTDPVHRARSEQYERPFFEYSLPSAILRFRQGFGRLIRSRDDRGVVAVLDNRIFTKRYGVEFVRALPRCTTLRADLPTIVAQTAKWLAR
ncbi:MAG: helicase C-terminal domain-containing protein [Dehalococcoidia bacterium]